MKKIIAVVLSAVLITTLFIACSKQTDTIDSKSNETVTEVMTDEEGETVTEVVTGSSGEIVSETVTEKVTKEDGTTETVTKTDPVTKAVTQASTTSKSTTTKKSGGSSGSSSKTTTTKKTTTTTKPSNSSKLTTTAKPTTTKPTTTKPTTTKPTTTAHTHNWVAQTKTETTYKWEQHAFCNGCGMDLDEGAEEYGMSVGLFQMRHCRGDGMTPCPETLGECGEYHYEQVKVATGTETVITGYKCSTCGATKSA